MPGGHVLCVTSGKGGTGKSTFAANLAVHAAGSGRRVHLLDADLGLANAHLLLGVSPRGTLLDLLQGEATPARIEARGPNGVRLLSGGSGIGEIAALSPAGLFRLIRKLERLRRGGDLVLVDTSAGIGPNTLLFLFAAREITVVTTPELTAMTDAYAVIKTLFLRSTAFRIRLLVNRCRSAKQARRAFEKLRSVTDRFTPGSLEFLGFLHDDPAVPAALAARRPVVQHAPDSPFSRGLRIVAARLLDSLTPSEELPHAIREILARGTPVPGDPLRSALAGSSPRSSGRRP